MDENKKKELLKLYENRFDSDQAWDAFEDFCSTEGFTISDVQGILSASKAEPTATSEKRESRKDKAANDYSTRGAITKEKIDDAYNVAEEERQPRVGALAQYVKDNGIFSRVEGEDSKEYADRQRNAFEKLGLNWDNLEDRALLSKSIRLLEQQDAREAIKDEKNSGLVGFLSNVAFPRMNEHADKDIMAGEETDGYLKDFILDSGEDVLMTAGAPVTGPAKAVAGTKAVAKAYKDFKKGKKILDGRTKANKALKGTGALAGYLADNAAVPLVTEAADAVAYDDPENPRSDFSNEDVIVGTAVNAVAPVIMGRVGGRLQAYIPEQIKGKVAKAADVVKKSEPVLKYLDPYVTNKFGRSNMAKRIPGLNVIVEEREKDVEEMKKKADALASRKLEWEQGLHIPTDPKDKYWDEFTKWAKTKLKNGKLAQYTK